jgi:hypothetical protein
MFLWEVCFSSSENFEFEGKLWLKSALFTFKMDFENSQNQFYISAIY